MERLFTLSVLAVSLSLCSCGNPCDKLVSFKCDPNNPDELMKCATAEKEIRLKCVDYMEKHESELNTMCESKELKKLKPCLEQGQKNLMKK